MASPVESTEQSAGNLAARSQSIGTTISLYENLGQDSPKPALASRRSFQPRDARVPKDNSLLDMASFLNDNPGPPIQLPVKAQVDREAKEVVPSAKAKFVRRVFKVASRMSGPINTADHGSRTNTRQKVLTMTTTQTPTNKLSKKSQESTSVSRTPSILQKQVPATAPTNEARPLSNATPSLSNLLADDFHGIYMTWLDREIGNHRRTISPTRSRETQPEQNLKNSTENHHAHSTRKSADAALHLIQSDQDDATRLKMNHQGINPSNTTPAPSARVSQSSRESIPSKRNALFNHLTLPVSPPPQKPLPPSPRASTGTNRSSLKTDAKSVHATAAQQILEDFRQDSLRRRVSKEPSSMEMTSSSPSVDVTRTRSHVFDSDCVTIPALHNIGVHCPVIKSEKAIYTSKRTSSGSRSTTDATELVDEVQKDSTTAIVPTIPAKTDPNASPIQSAIWQGKLREGRTRAKKLKHLHSESRSTDKGQSPPTIEPSGLASVDKSESDDIESNESSLRGEENPTQAGFQEVSSDGLDTAGDIDFKAEPTSHANTTEFISNATSETLLSARKRSVRPPNLDLTSKPSFHTLLTSQSALTANIGKQAYPRPQQRFSTRDNAPPTPPPSSPPPHPVAARLQPNNHHQQTRIAHLERENKLLQAALMAVLKTGGALNRCPCPCYCGVDADADADAELSDPSANEESIGAADLVASENDMSEADNYVDAAGRPESPVLGGSRDRSSRIAHANVDADGSGSGGALALYMQTRRASGFGSGCGGGVGVDVKAGGRSG